MQKKTHIAFGLALGTSAWSFFDFSQADFFIYGAGIMLGSVLPDIDHPSSFISRKIPILPAVLSLFFRHRTFFHSLLFIGLLALVMLPYVSGSFYFGILLGVASHLIGDMMTSRGVQLLYPWGKFIRFPITFRTGGVVENIIFWVLSVIIFFSGTQIFFYRLGGI